jgi:hypothetical protein
VAEPHGVVRIQRYAWLASGRLQDRVVRHRRELSDRGVFLFIDEAGRGGGTSCVGCRVRTEFRFVTVRDLHDVISHIYRVVTSRTGNFYFSEMITIDAGQSTSVHCSTTEPNSLFLKPTSHAKDKWRSKNE